ncbi:hypothetical protein [Rhodoferax sp. WC2427]|uniref:hypothetical protein n=1 Tax=Rhodoferax sp. WC2427 TaxID=3234144 RepID=UPI003467A559
MAGWSQKIGVALGKLEVKALRDSGDKKPAAPADLPSKDKPLTQFAALAPTALPACPG